MINNKEVPSLTDFLNQNEPDFQRLPINYFLFTTKTSNEWEQSYNQTKSVSVGSNALNKIFVRPFYKRISKCY
jgi:hypothetical protein